MHKKFYSIDTWLEKFASNTSISLFLSLEVAGEKNSDIIRSSCTSVSDAVILIKLFTGLLSNWSLLNVFHRSKGSRR